MYMFLFCYVGLMFYLSDFFILVDVCYFDTSLSCGFFERDMLS